MVFGWDAFISAQQSKKDLQSIGFDQKICDRYLGSRVLSFLKKKTEKGAEGKSISTLRSS